MSALKLTGLVVLCAAALLVAALSFRDGGPESEHADPRELAVYDSVGVRLSLPDLGTPEARRGPRGLGFGPAPLAASSDPLSRAAQELSDGRFGRAIGLLERALESDSEDPDLKAGLSAAYLARGLSFQDGAEPARPADLVEALDRIGPDPTELPSLFNRGLALEALYCFRMSARTWERYLELDPGSDWGALAAERLDRVREILAELERGPEDAGRTLAGRDNPAAFPGLATALQQLRDGLLALDGHRIQEGAELLESAWPVLEAAGDSRRWLAEEGLARVDYQRGRYDRAEERALRVLAVARAAQDVELEDGCLRTLAYLNLGRLSLQAALVHAEARLALGHRTGNLRILASADFTLSRILDELGEPDGAWAHRISGFRSLLELREGYDLALSIQNSSFALARQELYSAAADFVSEMLEIDRETGDPQNLAESLWIRAGHRARGGDSAGAAADLGEARSLLPRVDDRETRGYLALRMGVVEGRLLAEIDTAAAIDALSASLAALESSEVEYGAVEILVERAKVFRRAGLVERAGKDLEEAVRQVAYQRSRIEQPILRVTFQDLQDELADEAVAVAVARGRSRDAFVLAESMKGIVLRELLPSRPDAHFPSAAPGAGWRPVVAPGEVLVSYWSLPDELLIWVVESGRAPVLVRRPIDRRRLSTLVDRLTTLGVSGEDSTAVVGEARRWLLLPVERTLAEAHRLVIVPDRFTRSVPWTMLTTAATDALALAEVAIRLRPTAIPVATVAERPSTSLFAGRLLAVGDPRTDADLPGLPAARAEVRHAVARFERSVLLVGSEATRSRVLAELPRAEIIHLSTHFITGELPWSTRVLLAPEESGADPSLGVGDVAVLNLSRARLVILSGCATGREGRVSLEGTYAAAGAFLAAGAQDVVFTLWPVDDRSAAALVAELYDRLEEGWEVDRALSEAQRALATSQDGSVRPGDWAAFQIISTGPSGATSPANSEGGTS